MRYLFLLCAVISTGSAISQKKEEGFGFNFQPATSSPRYYVITEKKDDRWYREAYYLPERTLAMKGWYLDEECKQADGEIVWYHATKYMKSKRQYKNGKADGIWLGYHENGMISDSALYKNGYKAGVALKWDKEGYQTDSTHFDGNGNGTQVSWYAGGYVRAAGRWTQDTMRLGKWVYYHDNGQVKATEIYTNGKVTSCECFTEKAEKLDSIACEGKDATLDGKGEEAWKRYVQRSLNPEVPIKKKAPAGTYTVAVRFVVDTDGRLTDIEPMTNFGYGMEQEVIRMIRNSPRWEPARQFGKKVRAYRVQPVSFAVVE